MSLEGLRAWIGEVERKLGKRTRVFLALTAIAIGIAGASVYLAIDTRNDSVSDSDVQELQRQLETRIDELSATGTAPPPVEPAEPAEPQAQPEAEPESKPKAEPGAESKTGPEGSTGGNADTASGGPAASEKLRRLFQQTKEKVEEAK